jgi:beta-aspartyl-dipeptidase (metallo-type)
MLIIKNALVYAPEKLGKKDLLIAGERIVAIEDHIDAAGLPGQVETIDAAGRALAPGFIDSHVHITGGGGEGGYRTRTPELSLSDATTAGVTTVVGVLGTDGVARSLEALVAKAYGLREEGLSAWCYTGAYRVPLPTISGDIMRDIMMIEPFIGAGEVALSDHRSTKPTDAELARLASEARLGGMLSGKAGIVNIHLGDAPEGLEPLERVCGKGDLPRGQFLPTHCNRNRALLKRAYAWAREGGYIDFTTSTVPAFLADGETSAAACLARLKDEGVPLDRATVTSDGQGSLPRFDAAGVMTGLDLGSCHSLVDTLREAVQKHGMALEELLPFMTANPARILKLPRKGAVALGMDADIVILDKDLEPYTVIARGRVMLREGAVEVRGSFEGEPT